MPDQVNFKKGAVWIFSTFFLFVDLVRLCYYIYNIIYNIYPWQITTRYKSICPSIHISTSSLVAIHESIRLSLNLSILPFPLSSVHPSIPSLFRPSIYPFIDPSIHPSFHPSIYPSQPKRRFQSIFFFISIQNWFLEQK